MPTTKEVKDFDLDNAATNSYIQVATDAMKKFNYIKDSTMDYKFKHMLNALETLLINLPPKGKLYMAEEKEKVRKTKNHEMIIGKFGRRILPLQYESELTPIYDKATDWLWPNLFELHMNVGKPAYTTEAHLGNAPRPTP